MNYSLDDVPDFGPEQIVWMDIVLQEQILGRIYIRLFRDVFPAGVENFIRIASGNTIRAEHKGAGKHRYVREVVRTYEGCKFFSFSHNNYIISGDIYNNDGSRAGTIFGDKPIPPLFGDYFYQHNLKGLLTLVPYQDDQTGQLMYDSTFMITLDSARPTNVLNDLNNDQIVIGQIYQGMEVLDHINMLIFPFAGKKYPDIRIGKCGTNKSNLPYACKMRR